MATEHRLLWTHDGSDHEPRWTKYTLLLLSGAPLEKIEEFMAAGFGFEDVPQAWRHTAMQRYQEAEAHDPRVAKTGEVGVVAYWAGKLGTVELEREGSTLAAWLVVDDAS